MQAHAGTAPFRMHPDDAIAQRTWRVGHATALLLPSPIPANGHAETSAPLYIAQPDEWTGSDDELASLQEKDHNYVAFAGTPCGSHRRNLWEPLAPEKIAGRGRLHVRTPDDAGE